MELVFVDDQSLAQDGTGQGHEGEKISWYDAQQRCVIFVLRHPHDREFQKNADYYEESDVGSPVGFEFFNKERSKSSHEFYDG